MIHAKNYVFKEETTNEITNLRVTYVDNCAQTIEHLVNGHAVSACKVKVLSDKQRKLLDTERMTGLCLNPSLQLVRMFELVSA